ncbi:PIR protein [Plasmodium vivax]|nr:PIR protein [Plasmodium vivax]
MNRAKWPYLFFDDIDNYVSKVQNAEITDAEPKENAGCNSFYETWGSKFKNRESAKSICGQFLKLTDSLSSVKKPSQEEHHYKKDYAFLNYWVNFHLSKSIISESNCVNYIYNALESSLYDDLKFRIPTGTIYDLDKDELNKMNILYNLYENYVKLNAIDYNNPEVDKQKLLTHSTACCTDYVKASYICSGDNKNNNRKFCEIVTDFESKYEKLYNPVAQKGSDYSKNFIRLSECGNNKIISTAITGSIIGLIPLFGVLYKFTPMGQVIRSKMGILNNDISNTEEEMTKISLMDHENEQLRFQKATYNIKYQSL